MGHLLVSGQRTGTMRRVCVQPRSLPVLSKGLALVGRSLHSGSRLPGLLASTCVALQPPTEFFTLSLAS